MTSAVLVALRVRAPRERAFAVFADEIGLWWRPDGLFRITPRGDGVLAFVDGRLVSTLADGRTFEVGRVTAWEPPDRLAFTWRQAGFPPDRATEVEVRFEAVGAETRVSVEHRGWDAIPRDHAARHGFPLAPFQQRCADWWRAALGAYAARLAA